MKTAQTTLMMLLTFLAILSEIFPFMRGGVVL
jgi:hypothetical protein